MFLLSRTQMVVCHKLKNTSTTKLNDIMALKYHKSKILKSRLSIRQTVLFQQTKSVSK